MARFEQYLEAARIIREAGGELVGRTRLQKLTYLSQLAGFGGDFDFEYHHYGPYSEGLANGIEVASGLKFVDEEEKSAERGGRYSIYRANALTPAVGNPARSEFIQRLKRIGAIELELAATAAYLFTEEHIDDAWEETARRKPEKATPGRLQAAKNIYKDLVGIQTPIPLPNIPL